MRVLRMTVGGVPPFTKPVKFELNEQVNLFVGPNATGKTTLLQQVLEKINQLATAQLRVNSTQPATESEVILSSIKGERAYLIQSGQWTFAVYEDGISKRPARNIINVPATRVRYGSSPVRDGSAADNKYPNFYGVSDFSHVLYEDYIQNVILDLYYAIEKGPAYEDNGTLYPGVLADAHSNPLAAIGLKEAVRIAHICAKEICQEVILGDAPLDELAVRESQYGLPEPHLEYGVRIATKDAGVPSLNMQSLSAGTEGTLWWIRMVAISLLLMSNLRSGWENQRALLLIDEIENHLHPTWQRRVIPALLKYFPGLQIFATTHSPFVVAGLKAGQVHLLNRDADGVITASTHNEDIVGWTMDEVLRTFMGVDDPTDERTATAARELRQLRDEGRRADEREEEQRQARMQELRRLVNRDMLAGGPRAAQRDLFEQQFAEALEKYRQAQDLNQENG